MAAGVTKVNIVRKRSAAALKAAIAEGPVAVAVHASASVFMRYRSGILNTAACGTRPNHLMTAIGYGNERGQDFYIVRNSWSSRWGD